MAGTTITSVAHRIAAVPVLYDALQALAGGRRVRREVCSALSFLKTGQRLLDVGGGTGLYVDAVGADVMYVCLDLDVAKLRRHVGRGGRALAIAGDATRLPVPSGSQAAVLMSSFSHHLEDDGLHRAFAEARRVLAPTGRLVFVDAVWAPDRSVGRMLWAADRGSYPRPPEKLTEMLSAHFDRCIVRRFAVMHEYVLVVAAQELRENDARPL